MPKMQSMVTPLDARLTRTLAYLQETLGASFGSVGEIGVHHGAYFATLASLARPEEPLWACDLFDHLQLNNLDHSGRGNATMFLRTVRNLTGRTDVRMAAMPSYELHRQGVQPPQPFRLLSIDGSHTAINAFTDLVWATRHVARGGLLVVDDVASAKWRGPTRALRSYWHMHDRQYAFLPLLLTRKKLWLVHRSWHGKYVRSMGTVLPFARSNGIARKGLFREFVACLNANERFVNKTVDYAPLWLPPPPRPTPRVWLERSACVRTVR